MACPLPLPSPIEIKPCAPCRFQGAHRVRILFTRETVCRGGLKSNGVQQGAPLKWGDILIDRVGVGIAVVVFLFASFPLIRLKRLGYDRENW